MRDRQLSLYVHTHTYACRILLVYLIMRGKRSIKKSAGVLSFQTHNFLNKLTRNGKRPEADDGEGGAGEAEEEWIPLLYRYIYPTHGAEWQC